jgi:hypothetical protein
VIFIAWGRFSETERDFERIFTCKSEILPMKYLGVPINRKILKNLDWDSTEVKNEE